MKIAPTLSDFPATAPSEQPQSYTLPVNLGNMSLTDIINASVTAALAAAAPQQKQLRNSLAVEDMQYYFDAWQRDGIIDNHSASTRRNQESVYKLLLWFLDDKGYTKCGPEELREFFLYLREPRFTIMDGEHERGRGRYGIDAAKRPSTASLIRPLTTRTYYGRLRSWFNYLIEQDVFDVSPLKTIKLPPDRGKKERIQPYTLDQKKALIRAARRSTYAKRDEAIVKLLLSTGMRANELCMLDVKDLDLTMKRCRIRFGKGGKSRTVNYGRRTARSLYEYKAESRKIDAPPETPFFTSERGGEYGQRLTGSGLHQLIARLVESAGITGVRRLVHSFRHTFAVDFLRRGGRHNELQSILGHEDPEMTMQYVNFAEVDVEERHIKLDPVDALDRDF